MVTFRIYVFQYCDDNRHLHSFPTRRSSDLKPFQVQSENSMAGKCNATLLLVLNRFPGKSVEYKRSEEHTSELQSHVNIVCRLLLEKKKSAGWRNWHTARRCPGASCASWATG